jgi:hypothetical protein
MAGEGPGDDRGGGGNLGRQQDRSGNKGRLPDLDQERLEYEVAEEIGVDPNRARQARDRARKGRRDDRTNPPANPS